MRPHWYRLSVVLALAGGIPLSGCDDEPIDEGLQAEEALEEGADVGVEPLAVPEEGLMDDAVVADEGVAAEAEVGEEEPDEEVVP